MKTTVNPATKRRDVPNRRRCCRPRSSTPTPEMKER
jgi:hypothetical protein